MKLFNGFEAVKFYQENLILITNDGYIYYIYNPGSDYWRKYGNAGNVHIKVRNYDEVSKEELVDAMKGVCPKKETDFMRMCSPWQLCIRDMLDLLREDYMRYMSDYSVSNSVHRFLLESDITYKSFLELKVLFDNAVARSLTNEQVVKQIKELSFSVIGRDIFKKEIGIVDGHDGSSYFGIRPVRVIDYSNTNESDNVAVMSGVGFSIEEGDVFSYLTPFLYKHFDENLEANKKRIEYSWTDENGNEQVSVISDFEWYLTHNFFTFESISDILKDIKDTIDALSLGRENEVTGKLKKYDTAVELIIDFYNRFIYRMEYMMKVGAEKGYNLISFVGP